METLKSIGYITSTGRLWNDFFAVESFVYVNFYISWLLIFTHQFNERPLECVEANKVMDSYCLYIGTFTIDKQGNVEKHDYIQWILIFMVLNCLVSCMPFLLRGYNRREIVSKYIAFIDFNCWKNEALIKAVQNEEHIQCNKEQECLDKMYELAKILNRRISYGVNTIWARRLIISFEVTHMFFFIARVCYTHLLINYKYLSLGFNWINHDEIFPKRTKCNFHTIGPSGTLQLHDVLCILSINFYFQWFLIINWYIDVTMAIFYIMIVVVRIMQFLFHKSVLFNRTLGPQVYHHHLPWVTNLDYSDWLLMKELSKNMNSEIFSILISFMVQSSYLSQNQITKKQK
ncbi:innexin inx7-like [Cimex lectularius]|uniref:Innexin n=1 Tax=Cimex lectularius TaxID=79782 RepID=A0A8I6SEE0_CIMLE|nr:innexin inx7-like [Cimex lectularius]